MRCNIVAAVKRMSMEQAGMMKAGIAVEMVDAVPARPVRYIVEVILQLRPRPRHVQAIPQRQCEARSEQEYWVVARRCLQMPCSVLMTGLQ